MEWKQENREKKKRNKATDIAEQSGPGRGLGIKNSCLNRSRISWRRREHARRRTSSYLLAETRPEWRSRISGRGRLRISGRGRLDTNWNIHAHAHTRADAHTRAVAHTHTRSHVQTYAQTRKSCTRMVTRTRTHVFHEPLRACTSP